MAFQILSLLLMVAQAAEVPLKADEDFKLELEYKFKVKPASDNAFIDLTETENEKRKRTSNTSPLPYLTVHLSFPKLPENEVRIRCSDNNLKNRLSKKAEVGKVYTLDLGFTEDMKDRITAYEYTFYLMDSDRKETSRIVLRVEADGTFLVNGARRGKF